MKICFPRFVATNALVLFTLLALPAHGDVLDNWVSAQFSTNGFYFSDVAYGNNRYVAVGGSIYYDSGSDFGVICTSEDGQSWTVRHRPVFFVSTFPSKLNNVIYANGLYLAGGYTSTIYSSTNGLDWILRRSGSYGSWITGITGGGPRFVAVGDGNSNSNIYSSTDGISWIAQKSLPSSLTNEAAPTSVAYGNGLYVAVGGKYAYTSSDGLTWNWFSYLGYNFTTVAFGNGIFIAPMGKGTNLVSKGSDPILPVVPWTVLTNNTDTIFEKIRYGNGFFVASGYSIAQNAHFLFTSTDGTNWVRPNFPHNNFQSVAFGDKRLITVGNQVGPPGLTFTITTSLSEPFASVGINHGNPPQISLSGLAGRSYRVEYLGDLQSTNWQTLSMLSLTNSPQMLTNTAATNTSRFYRSVLLP